MKLKNMMVLSLVVAFVGALSSLVSIHAMKRSADKDYELCDKRREIELYTEDKMDFHNFSVRTLKYLFDGLTADDFKVRYFSVITGKGNHSDDGPVLRDEVIKIMDSLSVKVKVDENFGVVNIGSGDKNEIPERLAARYEQLQKLRKSKGIDYEKLAKTSDGKRLLIEYASISSDKDDEMSALLAVIKRCAVKHSYNSEKPEDKPTKKMYKKAVKSAKGREALLKYASIQHDKDGLLAVIKYCAKENAHWKDTKDKKSEEIYREAAKSAEGREALIIYCKIPEMKHRAAAIKSVIRYYGGRHSSAKHSVGRQALVAYGKIPDVRSRKKALRLVIRHYGCRHLAVKNPIGRDALISYGQLRGVKHGRKVLKSVIGYYMVVEI